MKIDFWKKIDVCMGILRGLLVLITVISVLLIISLFCSYKQKDCFISQNEYCVVLNKDSHIETQVSGKFVTTIFVSQINTVGLTTQDTITININSRLFDNIEIGDTIKTIKLR
mgnify:CR=1 FL=1